MNAEIAESVQQAITPAECSDLYYPGQENTDIQCYATTVENRYIVSVPSINFGSSSTVVFNPQEGMGDIILTAQLPAPSGSLYTNWALSRGWLSQCLRSVGLRLGGSSLYYFTSDQLEIQNFVDCEDSGKKNALWALSGAELLQASDFADENKRSASIYIKLPTNTISALQKQLPFPTDLSVQPIQLILEWNRAEDVFFPLTSPAVVANLPSGFANAQVQFKQVHMADTGNLLARRANMNQEALTIPLRNFQQTVYTTNVRVGAAGEVASINLTGFRSGSVKNIYLYALQIADGAGAAVNVGNRRNYAQMPLVQLSVNGLIYYDSRNSASQLWSLCDLKTPATFDNTVLSISSSTVATATPVATPWVVVPFAQTSEVLANHNEVVMGLPIQNAVVNLNVAFTAAGTYRLFASYQYVASLMASKGSFEYVF
jgi:hypothetical protein